MVHIIVVILMSPNGNIKKKKIVLEIKTDLPEIIVCKQVLYMLPKNKFLEILFGKNGLHLKR